MAENDISRWGQAEGENEDVARSGWPEGQTRSTVNNRARENMAASRRWYEDAEWVNLLEEAPDGFQNFTKQSDTSFRVEDATGGNPVDASGKFIVGSWVRILESGVPVYGEIATSSYSAPNTTVTLTNMVDANYGTPAVVPTTIDTIDCYSHRRVRETAFLPSGNTRGQTPPQVPTIDDLGTAADFPNATPGGLLDADLLDGMEGADYLNAVEGTHFNAIINGDMVIDQRLGGSLYNAGGTIYDNTNESLTLDRWVHIVNHASDPDSYDLQRIVVSDLSGFRYALRMTANNTGVKGGIFQIVESDECFKLRMDAAQDPKASVSFWVRSVVGINFVKARLLASRSPAVLDAPNRDPIPTTWGLEDTSPTFGNNWTAIGTEAFIDTGAVAGTWTRVTIDGIALLGTDLNYGLFIWVDDTSHSALDTLDITGVQLEPGAVATSYRPDRTTESIQRCQRFFWKTYDTDVVPGTVDFNGSLSQGVTEVAISGSGGEFGIAVRYPVEMLKAPTPTLYNPRIADTTGSLSTQGGGANDRDGAIIRVGTRGAQLHNTDASSVPTGMVNAHVVFEAEM